MYTSIITNTVSTDSAEKESSVDNLSTCTLYVCTSCRMSGMPRNPKENRPGFILFQRLTEVISNSPLQGQVTVKAAECLSICPRPCGIAIATPHRWHYLFGDQNPEQGVEEIVQCVSTYLQAEDGFMARSERPKSLRNSILGRIPPLGEH